jgi:cell division protein FtsI/penicillin-binding protein 2
MNDDQLKQITKQLKFIKFWLSFFGSLILITLLVLGYFVYQVITFTSNAAKELNSLQDQAKQSLDLKQKICANDSNGIIAEARSNFCAE